MTSWQQRSQRGHHDCLINVSFSMSIYIFTPSWKCVMLFYIVSYENIIIKSYQGFYYILMFSVVYITGSATDAAACTYFMKCTDFLMIIMSCCISSKNIMHGLLYCYFTVNLLLFWRKQCLHFSFALYTFLFICVSWIIFSFSTLVF